MLQYKKESQITPPGNDYTQRWTLFETVGAYNIWCRSDGWDTIWQAVEGTEPPSTRSGGYYNRDWLLKIKGLR